MPVEIKNVNLYSKILIYAVLSRGKFCREFTHFFGVLFLGKKIRWRTKNDYYEVCLRYNMIVMYGDNSMSL